MWCYPASTFINPKTKLAFQVSVSPLDQSFVRAESSAPVLNTVGTQWVVGTDSIWSMENNITGLCELINLELMS